ncbi:MAG: hypothetical protein V4599_02440 [Verrucomicrobiota bacterium]
MKKPLFSALVALAIFAAVILLTGKHVPTNPLDTGSASQVTHGHRNMEEVTLPKTDPGENRRIANEKYDELYSKIAAGMTPETRDLIWRAGQRRTVSLYKDVFDSLNLDLETANQAMEIILEREKKKLEAAFQGYEDGYTKGSKKHAETSQMESYLAEAQLRKLLGDRRYEDLAKAEVGHKARVATEAQKIVRKLNND